MTARIDDLERAYDRLAAAIDAVGEERESLFLARLALVIAERMRDAAEFDACIETALEGLASAPEA